MTEQPGLPGLEPATLAPGLVLRTAFVGPDEAASLLDTLRRLPLGEVRMHGVAARRRVAHFGVDYAYGARAVSPGRPLPAALLPLRDRAAAFAGVEAGALREALVTLYPPGAGIGWHRDAPAFDRVVGVSLGARARMRFRRGGPGGESFELWLEPGSAYLLAGAVRWGWQHQLPPVKAERWSVTFRTMRGGAGRPAGGPPPRGGS